MNNKRMRIIIGLLTACLVALLSANAQGDKTKVKGLITARTGDTILKTTDGSSITVTLDDDTKVQQPKGLGVRKKTDVCCRANPGPQGFG
jgi:hypothetical protein